MREPATEDRPLGNPPYRGKILNGFDLNDRSRRRAADTAMCGGRLKLPRSDGRCRATTRPNLWVTHSRARTGPDHERVGGLNKRARSIDPANWPPHYQAVAGYGATSSSGRVPANGGFPPLIGIGTPRDATPPTPPGIRVTYHGGSTGQASRVGGWSITRARSWTCWCSDGAISAPR
jgi:hypothetical protein